MAVASASTSSASNEVASIIKAKLIARQNAVQRDLALRNLGKQAIGSWEFLFVGHDLLTEMRHISGSHITLMALESNTETGICEFQETLLRNPAIRADSDTLSMASKGYNTYVPFPVGSSVAIVRAFDSKSGKKLDGAALDVAYKRENATKKHQTGIVSNPYLLPGCVLRAATDLLESLSNHPDYDFGALALTPSCYRTLAGVDATALTMMAPFYRGVLINQVSSPPTVWLLLKGHVQPVSRVELVTTPSQLMANKQLAKAPHTRAAIALLMQMLGVEGANLFRNVASPDHLELASDEEELEFDMVVDGGAPISEEL